jgi:hypothetical protein
MRVVWGQWPLNGCNILCLSGWEFPKDISILKDMKIFIYSVHYCSPILIKIWMCWQIFVKLLNIKFPENWFSSFIVICNRWTDRHGEDCRCIFTTLLWVHLETKMLWFEHYINQLKSLAKRLRLLHLVCLQMLRGCEKGTLKR